MPRLLQELEYRLLLAGWKRRSARKRRAKALVGDLPAFFGDLARDGISYVVLRWFDEVPLTPEEERSFSGDVDVLVDADRLEDFCRAVSRRRGRVKLDLYSNSIRLGTDVKRIAYYPPLLAAEILENRTLRRGAFMGPAPVQHLLSFVYHLVYHKGLLAGLPPGLPECTEPPHPNPSHDPGKELRALAQAAGMELPEEPTLLGLHRWLQERQWNMPFDLLPRWPSRNQWHDCLYRHECRLLRQELGPLHDLLVFLVREDAVEVGAQDEIVRELRKSFQVLDIVELSPGQQQRVMRQTRGGDWTRHKSTRLVRPLTAVVCHDPHPVPVSQAPGLAARHLQVTNANVFVKHRIRAEMEERHPGAADFMHGSDNDLESLAYIKAVYGEDWRRHAREWPLA